MNKTRSLNSDIDMLNEEFSHKINIALLLIHVGLLVSFTLLAVEIMVLINIISIIIYSTSLKIVRKNPIVFLLSAYFEILIHMVVATLCLGWQCGFQLYVFLALPLVYYAYYVAQRTHVKNFPHIALVTLATVSYFITRIYAMSHSALYGVPNELIPIFMFTVNACGVFAFSIIFLSLYVKMSINIEILLKQTAEYDGLTGLANRHKINVLLNELVESNKADENNQFSIGILDIDNFKHVNDTYGHNVGDEVIKALANIIKGSENEYVHACRWGGEEFLITCSTKDSKQDLVYILQHIRKEISNTYIKADNKSISVTISAGVTDYQNRESIITTIGRADSYLYVAKASGKNQIHTSGEVIPA